MMGRRRANTLLLLTAFLWGAGNVAQQTVLDHIGPVTAVGIRCIIAALVLFPFALRSKELKAGLGKAGKKLVLLTICSFATGITLLQIGFGQTTVINASFLVNTATVMTPLGVWIYTRRRPSVLLWPIAIATFAGACLMVGGSPRSFNTGDVLCLLAAVFYVIWTICLGEFMQRHRGAFLISLLQFSITGLLCTILGLFIEPFNLAGLRDAAPELILLGVFSTGLGYVLQAIAQEHTPPSEANIILSGEAVFGAMGGMILLGETLNFTGFLGALLILICVFLVQMPDRRFSRSRPTKIKSAVACRVRPEYLPGSRRGN